MTEIKYDVRRGADIYRAIYEPRLQKWISTGRVKQGEVFIWRSGLSGWRKPEELEEFAPYFKEWERYQLRRAKKALVKRQFVPLKKRIKNILIIDDEKDMCSLLQDALSSRKYNVVVANTKRDALSCIRRQNPDMIFLDLRLPDGDGMNVLSRIKKKVPQTIVNIISAYGSEERREEARQKGADAFINKPFNEDEILRRITRLNKQMKPQLTER